MGYGTIPASALLSRPIVARFVARESIIAFALRPLTWARVPVVAEGFCPRLTPKARRVVVARQDDGTPRRCTPVATLNT